MNKTSTPLKTKKELIVKEKLSAKPKEETLSIIRLFARTCNSGDAKNNNVLN